ncbi:MAG: Flp pilus assembly protein TadB, partial [Alphaproteobacteria bacterium]
MLYIYYISISVFCVLIYVLLLKITQKVDTQKATKKQLRNQVNFVITTPESNFADDNMNQFTKETLEKIRLLEVNPSKKESFINNIKYQASYVYDNKPMNRFLILILKTMACIMGGLYFMGAHWIVVLALGGIASPLISKILLTHLFDNKISSFLDNFGYAMDMIVRGTRTGLAIHDCFKQIVKDANPIVAEQFLGINDDYKLGMTTETVMERFMHRLPLKEVQFFCLSIIIQNKTGGNLAEIIEGLSKILRNRKTLLVKIQTLSSEAKSSAIIMGCMPLGVMGGLAL